MLPRVNRTHPAPIAVLTVLAAISVTGLALAQKRQPAQSEDALVTISPVESSTEVHETLEDIGVLSKSFLLRSPVGHDTIVSVKSVDENGEVVSALSRRYRFSSANESSEIKVRLTKIDPGIVTGIQSDKILWKFSHSMSNEGIKNSGTNEAWDRNRFRDAEVNKAEFQISKPVVKPLPDKDHRLWELTLQRGGPAERRVFPV